MTRLVPTYAAFALLIAGFAGCIQEDAPPLPTQEPTPIDKASIYAKIKELMAGVPCEAPFSATDTTANLRQIGNVTLADDGENTHGSRELDVRGDLALTTLSGFGGIGLFDITDPTAPLQLSVLAKTGELDVKFMPDNVTAVAGGRAGITIVDLSNTSEMKKVGSWTWADASDAITTGASQNAHMLSTARIAGNDWVFLAPNSNSGVWILKMEGTPEKRKLTFVAQTLPVQGGPLGPHDMTVQYDEDLKGWVLYSADGFHGWTAWDVNDPSKPMLIGGLVKPETGYTHTIQAAKIGNRRILATIQEVGVNVMQVFDATNLRAPVLLGAWQHQPGAVNPQHNINFAAGRLYVAHYGNGVYVFDFNKLGTTPGPITPVAHYGGGGSDQNPLGFAEFYDVVIKNGIVWAASYDEPTTGVHAIGDGCLTPGDEKLTSIG